MTKIIKKKKKEPVMMLRNLVEKTTLLIAQQMSSLEKDLHYMAEQLDYAQHREIDYERKADKRLKKLEKDTNALKNNTMDILLREIYNEINSKNITTPQEEEWLDKIAEMLDIKN